MPLQPVDLLIIAGYVVATAAVGLWIATRAAASLRSYVLGGNRIPWYLLGVSNASGMFDISGTMWLVYLLFVYGLKSIWIPWLWPVFNQIFLMMFLSTWLRRSGVMTGAEWITFRFGRGRGADLAHLVVVLFAIVNVVGFLAYGFVGIGKFTATFVPWRLAEDPTTNANLWGLAVTGFTTLYVVRGGMLSVVFTEVLQYAIMAVASVWVGIVAMQRVAPGRLAALVPDGWHSPFFGRALDLDWSRIMPAVETRIAADGWSLFSAFFMMTLFKGLLLSGAGPAPNYDMQRILSARTPSEAAKMSGFVTLVLMFPRYLLVAGLAVLALAFLGGPLAAMGGGGDFELVLPLVLRDLIPAGLLGLLIAALLAAFMGTYAATVNAAPAYVVNDVYRRYVNPRADQRTLVRLSYATSIAVVVVGTGIGFFVASLNDIVQWIVSALYGGYAASNLLKWYWWRFNSYGYFWGMLAGIAAAGVVPAAFPGVTPLYTFPIILALSLVGAVVATLATPPDDPAVLARFYLRVRPWGFWRPVRERLLRTHPGLQPNRDVGRDLVNVAVGIVWQTALVAAGIYVVLRDVRAVVVCAALVVGASAFLKRSWYDRLRDWPADLAAEEDDAAEPTLHLAPPVRAAGAGLPTDARPTAAGAAR